MNTAHQITYQQEVNDLIKSTSNSAFVDALINDWCDELKHNIKIKQSYGTACWAFHNNQHHIYIGSDIFNHVLRSADGEKYITALLHHELAHGLWTSRDLVDLSNLLNELEIPFRLFNLMEDARIEHKWRELTSQSFNWQSFEKVCEVNSPIDYYFSLIFFEGEAKPVSVDFDLVRIIEYYHKTINAKSSLDLVPILSDWINEFGDHVSANGDSPSPFSGSCGTGEDVGDLMNAVQVAESGSIEFLDEDSESVESGADELSSEKGHVGGKHKAHDVDNSYELSGSGFPYGHKLIRDYPIELNSSYANDMALRVRHSFRGKQAYKSTHKPSKRLNMRAMSGNKDLPMYSRKLNIVQSKVNVNLIIDCSGSMYYSMKDATMIVSVFNKLVEKGVVNCNVILSSDDTEQYPVIKLPVEQKQVALIAEPQSGHGEGLADCFKANIAYMKAAKYNFVITDGDIVDGPIDKAYYQSRGVFTIGLYSGEDSHCEDLTQWFDIGIKRNDLDSLFSSLVYVLKS